MQNLYSRKWLRKSKPLAAGALVVSAVIVALLGAANRSPQYSEVLETGRLILRKKDGQPRAILELDDRGNPRASFLGKDGTRRLIDIFIDDSIGPVVKLTDSKDNASIIMRMIPNGPSIDLANSKGDIMMSISHAREAYSAIYFYDVNSNQQMRIISSRDGSSFITLMDSRLRDRISVGVKQNDEIEFEIWDNEGRPILPRQMNRKR